MAGRSADASAFRPARTAGAATAPTRRQAVAMLVGLVLVAAGVATASYLVRPDRARSFDLFYGSLFIDDERAPVAVDLTNGRPTVRLVDAAQQVSAKDPSQLAVVPLTAGTLLLNRSTGEFNLVDATGLVIKTQGGGVPLPAVSGTTASVGVAADRDAYVVRTGPGGTSVFLVGPSTVQQATGAGAKVTPRASVQLPEATSTGPGAQTSDGSDLWLLTGPPGAQTVRRLSLPPGSDPGATLRVSDHGTVSGPAALAHAAGPSDVAAGAGADSPAGGTGGQSVAVASAARLTVFDGGRTVRDVPLGGLQGTDRVLPASNQAGRFRFLFHTPGGWRLVSVNTDGSGLDGPVPVSGIDPGVSLAAPATSRGALYTMDLGTSGRLWRIGDDGRASPVSGSSSDAAGDPVGYPTARAAGGRELEAAAFGDAYVVARAARVVFDSPDHVKALAVFTDGTRPPAVIDKSAATDLNAAGGAAALAARHRQGRQGRADSAQPKPDRQVQPAAPVNNAIDCRTVQQVPHIPVITQATPGSRSVQLLWTYPLLDTQDCAPSTYTVTVRLLSADAPSPPASVTVQGQNGVTIAKLFPSTRYALTVTAFINGRGTPSTPVEITTGPEGPAAPTAVHADVDSAGNWTVTWTSCGGVREGCVPASSWNVVPQLCDGLPGLSSPPPVQSVAGDPTQHTFRTVYPGSDGLLGHGLSFQVLGIGEQGTVGTPASSGGCAFSWSTPVASQISLVSSLPSRSTQGGAATSATLNLRLAGDPVRTAGGIGAQFTYSLLSGGSVVSTVGPTTQTTVSLPGVRPGRSYTAVATVAPPRHPDAAVTIGPVPVDAARSDWPDLGVTASFHNDNLTSGTLSVHISGVSSSLANGETFALRDSGLSCGPNDRYDLTNPSFDPAGTLTFSGVSRVSFHGDCSVTVQLQENGDAPLYFGGNPSPSASTGVTIAAPSLGTSSGDFNAVWVQGRKPSVAVSYTGGNPLLMTFASNWSIALSSATLDCGSTTDHPTATIDLASKDCRDAAAAGQAFEVSVSFSYFGQDYSFTGIAVQGSAPQPIDPTQMSFTAAWDTTSPSIVITTSSATYDNATLASLQWSETVSSATSANCAASQTTLQKPTTSVPADACVPAAPPASGGPSSSPSPSPSPPPTYTVDITFTDPNYGTTHTYTVTVTGTPPS